MSDVCALPAAQGLKFSHKLVTAHIGAVLFSIPTPAGCQAYIDFAMA